MTGAAPPLGVIIAGGEGRRLGGREKGLMRWQGEPMVQSIHRALSAAVPEVLICANRYIEQYRLIVDQVVPDRSPHIGQGPLAGLLAGLEVARDNGFPAVITSPCDTPEISTPVFIELLAQWRIQPDRPVYAQASRDHPLHGVYPVGLIPSLTDYLDKGERRVMGFARTCAAQPVDCRRWETTFYNRNRPEDFR